MSTRYNNGSHYENHQRAAELHDVAAHAHRTAAEHRGQQDHLTAHEQSREAMEHSRQAFLNTQHAHEQTTLQQPTGVSTDRIAALAYEFWEARGHPENSAEEDWLRAEEQLKSGDKTD